MRIGFDATLLAERKSGIGYYAENLLRALADLGEERPDLLLLSNRPPVLDRPTSVPVPWHAGGRFPSRALWMQLGLPALLPGLGLDLVHYVNFNAPAFGSTPYVVTFHDLALRRHPELFGWQKRYLTRSLMPHVARRARAILVVSETVRGEVVAELGVDPRKVHTVWNAAGDLFRPVTDARVLERVRTRHGIRPPFVLAVGTLEPRKNLSRLLAAFDRARSDAGFPHRLVVAGARGWKMSPLERQVAALRDPESVRFLDYVPLDDLPALYSMADLFVFPSLYEGFGIPLVEAMRCGAPVLASDIPVHREVMAGAGEYVDPEDEGAIARALVRALGRSAEAGQSLREAALRRGQEFSWERAARETLEVYRWALDGGTTVR